VADGEIVKASSKRELAQSSLLDNGKRYESFRELTGNFRKENLMAPRKGKKPPAERNPKRSKRNKQKTVLDLARLSHRERLPVRVPGAYQVATGTGEEILDWLKGVPKDGRLILIQFADEGSYKKYGPIYWQLARMLPLMVAQIQRQRGETIDDALTAKLPPKP
jgi:hypothetical protein